MAEAAAAISLVASIAPLIDLGVKVIARLNDFTTRTCEVPESFRALGRRLPLLISTLRVVQQQADAGRFSIDVTTSLRNLTQSTSTQLAVIETCLAQITPPPPDASRIHRVAEALQSLTKDGSIRAAIGKIQRYRFSCFTSNCSAR